MNPATKFDLWDHQIEEVLPSQKYFGRYKQFSLDNLTDRFTLALAKLLQNLRKDPNTFALNIPDDYTDKEWEELRDVLKVLKIVGAVKSKPMKRKRAYVNKEMELKEVYLPKSRAKKSRSKKSKKIKSSKRKWQMSYSSSLSWLSSSSSSSSSENKEELDFTDQDTPPSRA